VETSTLTSSETTPTICHRFFAALDGGDFDTAANMFAADGVFLRYLLPKVEGDPNGPAHLTRITQSAAGSADGDKPDPHFEVLRGRAEIRAYFTSMGTQPYRHQIIRYAEENGACFVQGIVVEPEAQSTFMSMMTFRDGEIVRHDSLATRASLDEVRAIAEGTGTVLP
jgi:hypothetical protein